MGDSALVLLSGGLDSATCLAIAQSCGYIAYALSFDYGQKHLFEIEAAGRLAAEMKAARHIVCQIDLSPVGKSALTDSSLAVPKNRKDGEIGQGIPVTYVPARNTIFLAFALAWAEVLDIHDIFIGVNAIDYSGYPDCRPEFIAAFETVANLATKSAVEGRRRLEIHTPLISLSKCEIIRRGMELGVDYGLTSTCYEPTGSGVACGECDACILRQKGFLDAGFSDPISYVSKSRY